MLETHQTTSDLDAPNIRQLLDRARAQEQTNAAEAKVLAHQARVLAHVSHDEVLEARLANR